ncbi:MAG: ImmA/IrrE family metallo-endopeptidase [Hafnia sp.]
MPNDYQFTPPMGSKTAHCGAFESEADGVKRTVSARNFKSAAELLAKYEEETGIKVKAPIDVDDLAKFLNVQVKEDRSLALENAIGQISFHDGDEAVVSINQQQNSYEARRRFTLAHGLGHFCLHGDKIKNGHKNSRKTMSKGASYWDTKESEATSFAAQLLMPSQLVLDHGREIIDEFKARIAVAAMPASVFTACLASLFKVPNNEMAYRLKALDIIK